MPEKFECLKCDHFGPLDVHGRCESCGSSDVVSEHVALFVEEMQRRRTAYRSNVA